MYAPLYGPTWFAYVLSSWRWPSYSHDIYKSLCNFCSLFHFCCLSKLMCISLPSKEIFDFSRDFAYCVFCYRETFASHLFSSIFYMVQKVIVIRGSHNNLKNYTRLQTLMRSFLTGIPRLHPWEFEISKAIRIALIMHLLCVKFVYLFRNLVSFAWGSLLLAWGWPSELWGNLRRLFLIMESLTKIFL